MRKSHKLFCSARWLSSLVPSPGRSNSPSSNSSLSSSREYAPLFPTQTLSQTGLFPQWTLKQPHGEWKPLREASKQEFSVREARIRLRHASAPSPTHVPNNSTARADQADSATETIGSHPDGAYSYSSRKEGKNKPGTNAAWKQVVEREKNALPPPPLPSSAFIPAQCDVCLCIHVAQPVLELLLARGNQLVDLLDSVMWGGDNLRVAVVLFGEGEGVLLSTDLVELGTVEVHTL
jgi:hypothetical protein